MEMKIVKILKNSFFNSLWINAFVVIIIFINSSYTQDIGIHGVKSWTDNYEIENPLGVGFFISLPIKENLFRINFDYTYLKNTRKYTGRIISGFIPVDQFSEVENIESSSFQNSYNISFLIRTYSWESNLLFLGLGFNVSRFDGHRKGLSTGIERDLWESNKHGLLFSLSFVKIDIISSRINMMANIKYKLLGGGNFATDIENTFSDEMEIIEVQLGLSYTLF